MRPKDLIPELKRTLVMILAGGQGQRLMPLTQDRAKPAVPFGGNYRIIDFPLSNCLNSGLRRIYVLTQYKSISLHRHIRLGWGIFQYELGEYIEVIPPQQRVPEGGWYRGTADAIFQNIYLLNQERPQYVLILAGDHVYKMDYREMLRTHLEKEAELTVACIEVPKEEATRFGVMEVNEEGRILGFEEKPSHPRTLPGRPEVALASMGIYIFSLRPLVQVVSEDARSDTSHDFGRDIIPKMVREGRRVFAHRFREPGRQEGGYWRDIGTLDSYYQANMDLVDIHPPFDLYDENWPIRTYQHQLPPAKTVFSSLDGSIQGHVRESLLSMGCVISGGSVERSVLSPKVRVHTWARVEDSILFEGVDVGRRALVRRAIVDKEVQIPEGAVLTPETAARPGSGVLLTEGGVVVVKKGAKLDRLLEG